MAAASAVKPGIDGAVYRNSGTYGSPTWAEITLIRDVSPSFPWDMADASSRTHKAKLYAKTMIDIGAQLVVRADDADAGYQALFDAAMSSTTLMDMLVLDGPITTEGSMGVRCHFNVNESGQSQGAGDVIYTTFDLKPGYHTDGDPKKIEVGATSTLTATAF